MRTLKRLSLTVALVLLFSAPKPASAQDVGFQDGFYTFPAFPGLTFYCMSSTDTCYLWSVPDYGSDSLMWLLNPYTWVVLFL